MKLSVQTQATLASLDKAIKADAKKVQRALKVNGMEMVDSLQKAVKINRSKFKEYTRRGVKHWSSRPGQYPNSDTGWLSKTIQLSNKKKAGSVFVIVGARYARALEFGSRKRGIAPRPFVRPIRDAKQKRFRLRVIRALNA